jgi:hypothetical protein
LTRQIKATLLETAAATESELIKPLFDFRNNGPTVGNGWTSPPNGARWSTDYLFRAATAKSNMYDNGPRRNPIHRYGLRFNRPAPGWDEQIYGDLPEGSIATG